MRRTLIGLVLAIAVIGTAAVTGQSLALAAPKFARADGAGPNDKSPYSEVIYAAGQNHARCNVEARQLTPTKLAAMMFAITWAETTGNHMTKIPHPMVLGRSDSYVVPGVGALDANRNYYYDATPPAQGQTRSVDEHGRVFWHAGLGMWQYTDTNDYAKELASGRFRPYDTVARELADRVCRYGHTTDAQLEKVFTEEAWVGCGDGRCVQNFHSLYQSGDTLAPFDEERSVSYWGGLEPHDCRWGNSTAPISCVYVDYNRADPDGHTGSWIYNPLEGGSDGNSPSPLSTPFYIFFREVDGGKLRETRVWLGSENAWGRDISAERPKGVPARESLRWIEGTSLCDRTTGHGSCS